MVTSLSRKYVFPPRHLKNQKTPVSFPTPEYHLESESLKSGSVKSWKLKLHQSAGHPSLTQSATCSFITCAPCHNCNDFCFAFNPVYHQIQHCNLPLHICTLQTWLRSISWSPATKSIRGLFLACILCHYCNNFFLDTNSHPSQI